MMIQNKTVSYNLTNWIYPKSADFQIHMLILKTVILVCLR